MTPLYTQSNVPTGTPPQITSFSANSTSVSAGTPVTLSWQITGASYVIVSPQIGAVRGSSVSVSSPNRPHTLSTPQMLLAALRPRSTSPFTDMRVLRRAPARALFLMTSVTCIYREGCVSPSRLSRSRSRRCNGGGVFGLNATRYHSGWLRSLLSHVSVFASALGCLATFSRIAP